MKLAKNIYRLVDSAIIRIVKLTENDADEVYQLLTRSFYKDEPLIGGIPPPKQEDLWLLKALPQGYSIKVVDENDKIVGVCINMDCTKIPDPPKPDTEYLKKVDKMMELVHSKIEEIQGLLDLHILAVEPVWRKRGLAGFLCDHTEKIAIQNDFKGVSILSTSIFSAKMAESRGYHCRYRLNYDRYLDGTGNPIFNIKKPHTGVGIYIKLLVNDGSPFSD